MNRQEGNAAVVSVTKLVRSTCMKGQTNKPGPECAQSMLDHHISFGFLSLPIQNKLVRGTKLDKLDN